MPSRLSEQDLNELIEDLLRLRNVLFDLRAEKYAGVVSRAKRAIGELRELIRQKMK